MRNLLAALILCATLAAPLSSFAEEGESAYDRVMRTHTIRCGYNSYEPVILRDPNTGEMSGIFPEYMNEISKATGLKIEWTTEVGWGEVPVALQTRKIDAMCAGKWPDARTGLQAAFTRPIFYNPLYAYTRKGDTRFDGKLASINDPAIKISVVEGGVAQSIADIDFPKAEIIALPILSTESDMLLDLTSGKADVTFITPGSALGFSKTNPDELHLVTNTPPLRVYPPSIAVDIHEQELLSLLNTATNQLLNSGIIDKILDKYEPKYPESFIRVAKPYTEKTGQ